MRLLLLTFILPALAAPAPALADDGLAVVVHAEGDLAVLARSNSESAAAAAGFSLTDTSALDADALATCLEAGGSCSAETANAPAPVILLIQVVKRDSADTQVIARLVQSDNAQLRSVDQRICEQCDSRERLAKLVVEVVAKVLDDYQAERAPDTFLRVEGAPPGALLTIDGVARGEALGTHRIRPGEHAVLIEKKGYRRHEQTVVVIPREQRLMRVELERVGVGEQNDEGSTTFRTPLGFALIGFGVAGGITGALWLAADGPSSEGGVRLRRETRSAGAGYGAIAVGGAAAIGGLVLILTDPGEDSGEGVDTVAVMPGPDGLRMGLQGRF